jgi:hypothetical protein
MKNFKLGHFTGSHSKINYYRTLEIVSDLPTRDEGNKNDIK